MGQIDCHKFTLPHPLPQELQKRPVWIESNRYSPQSSTTNSKMVSWLPSSKSGKESLPWFTRNSSILARSSSSSRAPTPHMSANTNRRLRWLALRTPCSSLLGIRPSRRSMHCTSQKYGVRCTWFSATNNVIDFYLGWLMKNSYIMWNAGERMDLAGLLFPTATLYLWWDKLVWFVTCTL